MTKIINCIGKCFLVLIFCSLAHTMLAQNHDTIDVAEPLDQPTLQENQNISISDKIDILRETQRSIDRSIDILDIVATLMGVLVGLFTAIIVIAIALGVFEYRRWRVIRKDAEKNAGLIEKLRDKAEKDTDVLRNEINKKRLHPLTQEPQEEIREKLDEFSRRLEFVEFLGISLKPEDYLNRGVNFYYKGKYELALKAFDKVTELQPNDHDAWNNKGLALFKLDRYDEALKSFDKAMALKPDVCDTWNNKGFTLFELGRHDEALKSFDKAIALKPDDHAAWNNKGLALSRLGRHDEALKWFDKAIALKPDHPDAWFNRACFYAIKGKKRKALSDLKKAIKIKPSYKKDVEKEKAFKNLWDDDDFKKIVS